jgi:YaiO family outer membrane protein
MIFAQEGSMDDLSVDELYEKARTAAFDDGNYKRARELGYAALDRSPNYHGIRIFIARTFSWEGRYEKARKELQYVLEQDPGNQRALLALADVESWSDHPDTALQVINQGLKYHSENEELLLKKASALWSKEEYEASEEVYKKILDLYPDSKKARDGLESAQLKQMKYSVSVSYRYDYFTEIFDPWKFTEVGLSRQTPYGSIIGRVQYAQRFGGDGVQFNLDAYPSIANGLYAYVSGGYSNSGIYPKYRFGFSLYKSLPASFELAAGIRYLDFSTSQTDIYTASITKYYGSYLFTVRSYFVPSPSSTSNSVSGTVRRYFGDANTYLSINGGYGSAQTEFQVQQDVRTLKSWSLGLDGQYPISEVLFVGGSAGYDSSEFQNFTRNRFSFKMFVSYRF